MSNDEADELMDRLERWDARKARKDFLNRMEKKMNRRAKLGYR